MGLKSKLNKMKSFLFDDEEDDGETKKIQKNIVKEENSNYKEPVIEPKKQEEENYLDNVTETRYKFNETGGSRVVKKEREFSFPEYNDEDFISNKQVKQNYTNTYQNTYTSPIKKEEPKRILYQGSKRKEETKKFKPSPIISPVYGLLNNEGKTVSKEEKENTIHNSKEEINFDDVRKKAYGNLDKELEDTLKRLSKKTIREAELDMENEKKIMSREKNNVFKLDELDKNKNVSLEDDMILPNVKFKEIDVDKERKRKENELKFNNQNDDIDDDTKEQDLFKLIDSMYQKKENDR